MTTGNFRGTFEETWAWALTKKIPLHSVDETESTNDLGKELSFLSLPAIVLARKQTKGRGRNERTWSTPEGALLSSWVLKPSSAAQPILSPLVGLALFDSAERAFPGLKWGLKAPNDLYIGDKKVAGILIESVITGRDIRLVVGVGVNVLKSPADVPTATAIADHTEIERNNWFRFLETFRENLKNAVELSMNMRMPLEACQHLANALNVCAVNKEPVISVSPRGDIVTSQGTRSWSEL